MERYDFVALIFNLKYLYMSTHLGNIKANGLYSELVFDSINFKITILSILTFQILISFFAAYNFSLATFVSPNLNIIILSKNYVIIFSLIDANI